MSVLQSAATLVLHLVAKIKAGRKQLGRPQKADVDVMAEFDEVGHAGKILP